MNIEIDAESERLIQHEIASGRFDSPEQVIAWALEQVVSDTLDEESTDDETEELTSPIGPPGETADDIIQWLDERRRADRSFQERMGNLE